MRWKDRKKEAKNHVSNEFCGSKKQSVLGLCKCIKSTDVLIRTDFDFFHIHLTTQWTVSFFCRYTVEDSVDSVDSENDSVFCTVVLLYMLSSCFVQHDIRCKLTSVLLRITHPSFLFVEWLNNQCTSQFINSTRSWAGVIIQKISVVNGSIIYLCVSINSYVIKMTFIWN